MILHIARWQIFGRSVVKLSEELCRHFAQGVDQHIQATTVGHPDHHFLHTHRTSFLHQLIHTSDEALAAFKRKTLLADIFGV